MVHHFSVSSKCFKDEKQYQRAISVDRCSENAFYMVKNSTKRANINGKDLILETDTSTNAVGGVLMQR